MNNIKEKLAPLKRNPLTYVMLMAYVIVIILFIISAINLSTQYTKLEKIYLEDAKEALNTAFSSTTSEPVLKEKLATIVEDYPMDLIVYDDSRAVYTTTTLTFAGMRDNANKNITLLQFQGKYFINDKEYQVACNLFHIQNPEYLTHLTRYQIILIGISIIILITVSAGIQLTLFKPLQQIKTNLNKFENYELEEVINDETTDDINEKLRAIALNLNENMTTLSRDYTQLEQALQVERERLKNTITVSRAFIHDLKSPLHQTMLENELVVKELTDISPQLETVINFNVRRIARVITTINEVLNMMDQNIYDADKKAQAVDLVALLSEAAKMFKPLIQKKEVYLELEVPETLVINSNKATIQLLIHNILSNAVAYATKDSEIICELFEQEDTVSIRCENETSSENIARMKNSEHIFYKNAEADEEHRYSSGKGLFLIKELAYVLNGDYQVSANDGHVIVEITLPKGQEE